jgi:hypothetical protein
MTKTYREQLSSEVSSAYWEDLASHAERDAILLVRGGISIVDAGAAIAGNDTEQVRRWVENGQLCKPTAPELAEWSADTEKVFIFLIVQPYVLVRPQEHR